MKTIEVLISSRCRRTLAFAIDFLVFHFIAVVVTISALDRWNDLGHSNGALLAFAWFCLLTLYLSKDGVGGVSLGRFAVGIAVRDAGNSADVPSLGRLAVRNLLLLLASIEFFALLSSKTRQRLGDRIAKTIVIRSGAFPWHCFVAAFATLVGARLCSTGTGS